MPKILPSPIGVKGTVDNITYVDSIAYGRHARKSIGKGHRKNEPALVKQNSRTAFLNKLASEINVVFEKTRARIHRKEVYQRLLKIFRKEPMDNRYMLLHKLQWMELHEDYALHLCSSAKVDVTQKKDLVSVLFSIEAEPISRKMDANSYEYRLHLITWDKKDQPPSLHSKTTGWLNMNNEKPKFLFEFTVPKTTTDWILAVHLNFGINNQAIGVMITEAMQVVDVGTFNKKDKLLREEVLLERTVVRMKEKDGGEVMEMGKRVG